MKNCTRRQGSFLGMCQCFRGKRSQEKVVSGNWIAEQIHDKDAKMKQCVPKL